MLEFLRDPIWQFIGAALGLLAILVGVYIYAKQQRKKNLSYSVVANSALLRVDQKIKGRVQILLDNRIVENVHYLLVKFINSGNVEIEPEDIKTALTINLSNNALVLSAEIAEVEPDQLGVTLSFNKSDITIDLSLMNAGDYFVVNILANGNPNPLSYSARISGVKRITPYIEARPFSGTLSGILDRYMISMLLIGALVLGLFSLPQAITSGNYAGVFIYPLVLMIGVAGFLVVLAFIALLLTLLASKMLKWIRNTKPRKTTKP